MKRCRFVQPDIVRLPLSDDHWIDVKKELNTGEYREMLADTRRQFGPGESPVLDGVRVGPARAAAYIVGWSFPDTVGQPVSFSRSAFDSLDTATSKEITNAIEAHEDRIDAERQEKKRQNPSSNAVETSISAT